MFANFQLVYFADAPFPCDLEELKDYLQRTFPKESLSLIPILEDFGVDFFNDIDELDPTDTADASFMDELYDE